MKRPAGHVAVVPLMRGSENLYFDIELTRADGSLHTFTLPGHIDTRVKADEVAAWLRHAITLGHPWVMGLIDVSAGELRTA